MIEILIYAVVISAIILFALKIARRTGVRIFNPFTGWRPALPSLNLNIATTKKVAVFMLWTIFLYVAAITLHDEASFLLSWKWFGILLLILVMVLLLCTIVDVFQGSKFTTAIFVLLTIAVVDPGILEQMPREFKTLFKGPDFSGGSSVCPGIAPTTPASFGTSWKTINVGRCDITYAVVEGTVLLNGPNGIERVSSLSNVVGRRNFSTYTEAKAEGTEAKMYYMLCPLGKGPINGGWICRS